MKFHQNAWACRRSVSWFKQEFNDWSHSSSVPFGGWFNLKLCHRHQVGCSTADRISKKWNFFIGSSIVSCLILFLSPNAFAITKIHLEACFCFNHIPHTSSIGNYIFPHIQSYIYKGTCFFYSQERVHSVHTRISLKFTLAKINCLKVSQLVLNLFSPKLKLFTIFIIQFILEQIILLMKDPSFTTYWGNTFTNDLTFSFNCKLPELSARLNVLNELNLLNSFHGNKNKETNTPGLVVKDHVIKYPLLEECNRKFSKQTRNETQQIAWFHTTQLLLDV